MRTAILLMLMYASLQIEIIACAVFIWSQQCRLHVMLTLGFEFWSRCCCCHHSNTFSHVSVSACPVRAVTLQSFDLETLYLVCGLSTSQGHGSRSHEHIGRRTCPNYHASFACCAKSFSVCSFVFLAQHLPTFLHLSPAKSMGRASSWVAKLWEFWQ